MAYFLAILAAALLAATPAHADPFGIGALITEIAIASTGPAGLFGIFSISAVSSFATALVTTAVGIGLSILFAPRPRIPPPEDGTIAVQQNLPYRIFAYGRTRIAGAIMLKEEVAAYLVYVAALTGHLVDGIETLFLNDDQVTVLTVLATQFTVGARYQITFVGTTNFVAIGAASNTVGVVFTATGVGTGSGQASAFDRVEGKVIAGIDGRFAPTGIIYMDSRFGNTPEVAYPQITALVPSGWPVTARGDNCASISMVCAGVPQQNFAQTYPYASPLPSAVLRGYQLFDPRDGTQDPANPATFKWSQNCALVILHFLCFSEFGFRYLYDVAILPVVSFWIEAANRCDDLVPLKAGGTEPRYTLGGNVTAQSSKNSALMQMLQCCDGFLARRGQSYALQVGFFAATGALSDADIVGWSIQSDVATEDKVNEATANYCSPANGYVTVDTDPVIDAIDQAARGGSPRKAQLDLVWCQSTGQASRLLVREMFRQGVPIRGTLVIKWSGLNAVYERWIAMNTNSIPRLSGAVIENRRARILPKTRTATIDFILSGPALDAYNPGTQESSPPSVPQRPITVGLPIPANVSVVPELTTDSSGTASVILDVSWDEPFFNAQPWNVSYLVQYRLSAVGAGSPGPWTQQSFSTPTIAALRVDVQTGVVPIGVNLDVEVASVGTTNSLSTFSVPITVSTNTATLAPLPPAWIAATGGSGSAALSVTSPNSANFFGIQFYRAAHGSPFSLATPIGAVVTGARNATIAYTDTVAAGTYDYFAVSETSMSVSSTDAGPETAVVT